MCTKSTSQPWYYCYPKHRAPVGYIDKENNYILLSEGDNSSGRYYDIWRKLEKETQKNPLYIIDTITKKKGEWVYNRILGCNNLECAMCSFLKKINRDFQCKHSLDTRAHSE